MSEFIIRANNKIFTEWKSVTVKRGIDQFCGEFSFISSDNQLEGYPIKVGDLVDISINGEIKVRGYVDEINSAFSKDTHDINVSGRDVIQDLIDSTLPIKAFNSTNLKNLCLEVIDALGVDIQVIDQTTGLSDFDFGETYDAETGQPCMEFLASFARKRNVFLNSNGNNGLVMFQPQGIRATTPLLNLKESDPRNNIKSRVVKISHQGRFNKYAPKSQYNFAVTPTEDYGSSGVNQTGIAIDDEIRDTRYFEFQTEEFMSDEECQNRANEEANIRRAYGTSYTAVVAEVSQTDGSLWDYGLIVSINDEPAGISGGFIIREVQYSKSKDGGSETTLVCSLPDAYKVTAVPNAVDSKKAKIGDKYQQ